MFIQHIKSKIKINYNKIVNIKKKINFFLNIFFNFKNIKN